MFVNADLLLLLPVKHQPFLMHTKSFVRIISISCLFCAIQRLLLTKCASDPEIFRVCHTLLDSLQKICLMHGTDISYYKKLFQTVGNILRMIEKDNLTKYLLFLEDVFPYMEKYQYKKGMKEIILEMKQLLKDNENSAVTDCFIPMTAFPKSTIMLPY